MRVIKQFLLVVLTNILLTPLKQCFTDANADANADFYATTASRTMLREECTGNMVGGYPCRNVALEAFLPRWDMSGSESLLLNDIWGWTDPTTQKEFALVGFRDGTAFVDISNPSSPTYIGFLNSHNNKRAIWRDIKTYQNYAYIVADAFDHGMQIFNLNQLVSSVTSNSNNLPLSFQESSHFEINSQGSRMTEEEFNNSYGDLVEKVAEEDESIPIHKVSDEGYAHNIAINEDSGYAYLIGSNNCAGGLYFVSLSDPLNPAGVGCFHDWGWIHDAQCVTYDDGPDVDYRNREICFVSYYSGFGIIDVTNKSNPRAISYLERSDFNSIDQGWLTEDKRYFLIGDRSGGKIRTYIVDVSNLDVIGSTRTVETSIFARHSNIFVRSQYAFHAIHRGGLRMLDLTNISSNGGGELVEEIGSFDTTPNSSGAGEDGVWGVYPFFSSGIIILSSVQEGLFIVRSTEIPGLLTPSVKPSSKPTMRPSHSPSNSPTITSSPSAVPSSFRLVDCTITISTLPSTFLKMMRLVV